MRALDDDLWVAEQPLRFGLLQLGTRMTVVRLSDSSLLLHSPISLTESLRMEIEELGSVGAVVAPNRFHHLFASEWVARYPQSRLYVAPGLGDKRPDLTVTGVLPQDAPDSWLMDLECILFEGLPLANEVVFFHKKTRTLMLCDLAFNIGPEAPWLTRVAFRLWGRYNDFGPTRFERLMIRNQGAAKRSLERILDLDFRARGCYARSRSGTRGLEAMRHSFEWLLQAA